MDISKINLFSTVANLKDADARVLISALQTTVGYMKKHAYYMHSRFLHFDFSDAAHKSVIVREGTYIDLPVKSGGTTTYITWGVSADTSYDLSTMMTAAAAVASDRVGEENGRVFNIFLVPDGNGGAELTLSTLLDAPSDIDASYTTDNSRWIGSFSTLCVAVGAGTTAVAPIAHASLAVSDSYLLKPSYADNETGFKTFYTKTISAVTSGTYYDTVTVPHTLAGFDAGDILPESVFCLGFMPSSYCCKNLGAMGMVYDSDTDIAVDIYLQSGSGQLTASVYGATNKDIRQIENFMDDQRQVGKRLLMTDEFTSAAYGSNTNTNISAYTHITGGHVDTANRRMTSFIGVEEMCGHSYQLLRDLPPTSTNVAWAATDGQGGFGQTLGGSQVMFAGGGYEVGVCGGPRLRDTTRASTFVYGYYTARGCCAMRTA